MPLEPRGKLMSAAKSLCPKKVSWKLLTDNQRLWVISWTAEERRAVRATLLGVSARMRASFPPQEARWSDPQIPLRDPVGVKIATSTDPQGRKLQDALTIPVSHFFLILKPSLYGKDSNGVFLHRTNEESICFRSLISLERAEENLRG